MKCRITTPLISALFAAAALVSCTGELDTDEGEFRITATADAVTTRPFNGGKAGSSDFKWEAGDRISVNGIGSAAIPQSRAGKNKTVFALDEVPESPYFVVFPESSAIGASTVSIPSYQTPVKGGFDHSAAVMAKRSTSDKVHFQHLCGYLKFDIKYPSDCTREAKYIILKGKNGETLAGSFNLTFDSDGNAVPGAAAEGCTSIVLTPGGNLTSFAAAMCPVTFTKGFTLDFYDADGSFMQAGTDASVEVVRSVLLTSPELSYSPSGSTSGLAEVADDPVVIWDEPVQIASPGVYGRVHRLDDGRLMACYSTGSDAYIKFSGDEGATWAGAKCIFTHYLESGKTCNIDNPDFAQLSSTNPYKPRRIIYAVNERVRTSSGGNAFPYHISILTSDDNGVSWSSPRKIFSSNSYAGCYEPFVLELPDGTVQIYLSDESPYATATSITDQNITLIESRDGGVTWGEPRLACYTKNSRDGMPTATIYDGKIYLAVEYSKPFGSEEFHPVVVYTDLSDNWSSYVGDFGDGVPRFDPFLESLQPTVFYNGAPYLAQTDNYFLIAYQTNRLPSGKKCYENSTLEVQVCPKSEMVNGEFKTMRSPSRPAGIDMTKTYANWNSVNCIGGDEVMVVFSSNGAVFSVKGKVTMARPKFN